MSRPVGDLGLDLGQELLELDRAVASVQARDHIPVGDIDRCEQGRGAVTHVVMGPTLGHAGIIGNAGWDRCNACTWDFTSTHSTTAASGGFKYNPTTS